MNDIENRIPGSGRRLAAGLALLLAVVTGHPAWSRDPGAEWVRIEGGPGTGCASGADFAFFAREGDPHRVMVFFEGGGACWNGTNCDEQGAPTFDGGVDDSDHPSRFDGLFDLRNVANPVAHFSMVFIPYCTGDVHLGSRDASYPRDPSAGAHAGRYRIRHQGSRNADAALGWLLARVKKPDIVLVAGSSAGAIPTPLYAAWLANGYPAARLVQLGDDAGGYRAQAIPALMEQWGARETIERLGLSPGKTEPLTFESLYAIAARAAPTVSFAQFNHVQDAVQARFLRLFGEDPACLRPALGANLADVGEATPRFRAYSAPGSDHSILASTGFYSLRVDGVPLRDWVAALIAGEPVPDVGSALLGEPRQAGRLERFRSAMDYNGFEGRNVPNPEEFP